MEPVEKSLAAAPAGSLDDGPAMSVDIGPAAAGVRLSWPELPAPVRGWVHDRLGAPVVEAVTQPGGFSPGVAARLRCANGRRAFCKAVSSLANPDSPGSHRTEARVAAALPESAPVPRLLAAYDDGTWVALLFTDIDGRQPALPWHEKELARVITALVELGDSLTPCPLPGARTVGERLAEDFSSWRALAGAARSHPDLDAWSRRHLDQLAELEASWPEAAAGNTLLHLDIRADNLLLSDHRVWFVDWPFASRGAAWVDAVFFAPSVAMQGGPPPEELLRRHPAARNARPDAVLAVICALTGYFIERSLRPPPPGLPTLRPFQAAQGQVARAWLARRTGWH
ncbi:MAG: hypothetical protein ACR2JO_09185 [Mycobacteriales bacterium]